VEKTLKIRRQVPCDACHGTGGEGGRPPEICGMCQGHGQVRRVERSFFGQFVNVGRCPQCGGRGRVVEEACHACRGAGTVRGEATVKAQVPAGADTGDYLSLRGEGDAAPQGGEPGDLQVVIEVLPMPGFERHGKDLLTELSMSPARAALGGKVTVTTLEGTATLNVPAGVQHGTLLRLKGKGLPPLRGGSRGSQFVRANVVIPEKLDKKRRKLYEELLGLESGEDR